MKLTLTGINKSDLKAVKNYLADRLRSDETILGRVSKTFGYVLTAVGVVESLIHDPIYFSGTNVNAVMIGFGLASIVFGYFTQSKTLNKTVVFEDAALPTQLDFFLQEIKQRFGADGAFVCKYHNGDSFGTFPSGRFTMIRSVDNRGLQRQEGTFYNQPMSLYAKAYALLQRQGLAYVDRGNPPTETKAPPA